MKLRSAKVMSIIFGPLKTLPMSSEICGCATFRVLMNLFAIFLFYTYHCHMILLNQKVLYLVKWCFLLDSQTYPCTSNKAGYLPKRNMTRINVGLALNYVKLLLSSWEICAIWLHGISTNSGDIHEETSTKMYMNTFKKKTHSTDQ